MIEVFNCEQRSPEWFACRAGIPTASEFSTVMASGKSGGPSVTRAKYMRQLAGEIITGEPMESYTNAFMERGRMMEEEARNFYAFVADAPVVQVGFLRNGDKGCSPDALVGDAGMVEIKTAAPHILIEALMRDEPPPEHKAQCQGNLWVAEREWIDLELYWPKMPTMVKRLTRDEPYIKVLDLAVRIFNEELQALVAKVRAYR